MMQIAGGTVLLIGVLVCLIGAIGIIRLPNFFLRTHSASITDTLGASLTLIGMMLYTFGMDMDLPDQLLVVVKLLFIGIFLLVSSPISGHVLTRAAYKRGLGGSGAPSYEELGQLNFGIHGAADLSETLERDQVADGDER